MPIPITHAIRAPIMITCGQLRCTLATSAACRAILGMGRHRKGERGRGRVGYRPRLSPPCLILLLMVVFHPLPLHVGLPQERSLLCLAVTYFVSLPQQHILLLALDLRFSLYPAISPEWEFLLYFTFFHGSLLFLCVILKVVWRVIQPTAEVRRRVFLFGWKGGHGC